MRQFAMLLAVGAFAASASMGSVADARPLKFNARSAINMCQRACSVPVNKARCCICAGGVWTGQYCI